MDRSSFAYPGQILLDCDRCGSAGSIDHGMCQVCLAEPPTNAAMIPLAPARAATPAGADLTLVLPA